MIRRLGRRPSSRTSGRTRVGLVALVAVALVVGATATIAGFPAEHASADTTTGGASTDSGAAVGIAKRRAPTRSNRRYSTRCDIYEVLESNPSNPKGLRGPRLNRNTVLPGTLVWQICRDIRSNAIVSGPRLVPLRAPGGTQLSLATVDVPDPAIQFMPPESTLPGVLTRLDLSGPMIVSAQASIGVETVTVYAALVDTTFAVESTTFVCEAPGWFAETRDIEPCTHRFAGPRRELTIDVTARWAMWWVDVSGAIELLPDHVRRVQVPYAVGSATTRVAGTGWVERWMAGVTRSEDR